MQVSWIDSEYLTSLLNDLGEATPEAKPESLDQVRTDLIEDDYTPPAGLVAPMPLPRTEPTPAPTPTVATSPVEAVEPTPTLAPEPDCDAEEEGLGRSDEIVAPEVERIRDRLRAVRERAEAAGLLRRVAVSPPALAAEGRLTAPSGSAFAPPLAARPPVEPSLPGEAEPAFEVPTGSIADRLDRFAHWVRQHFSANELLLLDEQGDVLWGAQAKADLVLSVMLAARAASRSSAARAVGHPPAHLVSHQALGESKGTLSVLACPTTQGLVVIGIEGDSSVSERQAGWLIAALKATVEGEN